MARLLIPTRNRPVSLSKLFEYLIALYPDTKVIVADGSCDQYKQVNKANIARYGHQLEIDYRQFPEDLHLADRLLEVLQGEPDECFIMGADDDFPNMKTLVQAEKLLLETPACVTAVGSLVTLNMFSSGKLKTRLSPVFSMKADSATSRVKKYLKLPFPTTYAVTRRTHLIERFKRVRTLFFVGFYDYIAGVHDVTCGKLIALPQIGYFCTQNYNHLSPRPDNPLFYLHKSDQVLKVKEVFQEDLMHYGSCSQSEADILSTELIKQRIATLAGAPR